MVRMAFKAIDRLHGSRDLLPDHDIHRLLLGRCNFEQRVYLIIRYSILQTTQTVVIVRTHGVLAVRLHLQRQNLNVRLLPSCSFLTFRIPLGASLDLV